MDLAITTYYAVICGTLGLAAPQIRNPLLRFAVGVVVGILASRMAPYVRGLLGAG